MRLLQPSLAVGALLAVVAFLTAYPLVMLVVSSLSRGDLFVGFEGPFGPDAYLDVYSDPATYGTWRNSLLLSSAVTVLSTALAILFAWTVARTDAPLRGIVVPLMVVVFMLPGIFGLGVTQIAMVISNQFASFLGEGAVSSLYYSGRVNELALGSFAIAISTAILPAMSRQAAASRRRSSTTAR